MQAGGHRFDPGQLHQLLGGRQSVCCPCWSGGKRGSNHQLGAISKLVPITALIVGGVIMVVVLVLRHQERIAKIERGIDPDRTAR